MPDTTASLRAQLLSTDRVGPGRSYPPDLRVRVARHVLSQRERGVARPFRALRTVEDGQLSLLLFRGFPTLRLKHVAVGAILRNCIRGALPLFAPR